MFKNKSIFFFLGLLFLIIGTGGCSKGATDSGSSGGAASPSTGVKIASIKDVPSLNISDYYSTGSSKTASLKADSTISSGASCTEFCYLNQCLQESLRHSKEIQAFLCMAKKAKDATGGKFDFPTSGFSYFDIKPPSMEGGTPSTSLKTKGTITATDAAPPTVRIRLGTDGDKRTFHMCESSKLQEEIILTQTSTGVDATATNSYGFGGCDDKGQMHITSNCQADAFTNPDCVASFDAKFNGCFGSGTINYKVTGGATARVNDLAANFNQGNQGAAAFGSSSNNVLAEWTGGGNGCFRDESSGSFPAIPSTSSEVIGLANIPGCKTLAASKPAAFCNNGNFDPSSYSLASPICPFVAATAATCPFTFKETRCCAISGASISSQTGTVIANSVAGTLYDKISTGTFPTLSNTVDFADAYDCSAPGGTTSIDMSTGTGTNVDFSECEKLFQDVASVSAESNCQEQEASKGEDQVKQQAQDAVDCTSNASCPSGQKCILAPGDTTGNCAPPPPTCTTDADCTSSCMPGDTCVCQTLPDFNNAKGCAPKFTCKTDDQCPPDSKCNATTGNCELKCPASTTCDTGNDFLCQKFADNNPSLGFTTANIHCNNTTGCCEKIK